MRGALRHAQDRLRPEAIFSDVGDCRAPLAIRMSVATGTVPRLTEDLQETTGGRSGIFARVGHGAAPDARTGAMGILTSFPFTVKTN